MLTLALMLSDYCIAINTLQIPLLPPWSSYQYLDGLGLMRYPGNQEQDIGQQPSVRDVKISMDTLTRLLKVAQIKGKVMRDQTPDIKINPDISTSQLMIPPPEYKKQPARKISQDLAIHLRRPRGDENEKMVETLNGMPWFGQELRKASGDTF